MPSAPILPVTLALGSQPTSSTGFATATDSLSAIVDDTSFTTMGSQVTTNATVALSEKVKTTVTYLDSDTVLVQVGSGPTYSLNRLGATGRFTASDGDTEISYQRTRLSASSTGDLVMMEFVTYDPLGNTISTQEVTSSIGYATAPAALSALGSATYGGTARLYVQGNGIATSLLSDTALKLDADFGKGTLSGSAVFVQRSGPVAGFTAPVNGRISGNAFAADVGIDAAQIGVASMEPAEVFGRFYGANGEALVGQGDGVAQPLDPKKPDIHYSLEVTGRR